MRRLLLPALCAVVACAATGAFATAAAGSPAPDREAALPEEHPIISRLPDGRVRSFLSRLPEDQFRLILDAAAREIEAIKSRQQAGLLSESAAGVALEEALGLRAALIVSSTKMPEATRVSPALSLFKSSEMVTAAYALDVEQTLVGSAIAASDMRETITRLLGLTPYIYTPAPPCGENQIRDARRLDICVDKLLFNSVAGLAWQASGALKIECSGQFLNPRFLVTADHCFLSHAGVNPTVLTHFTGGTANAVRGGKIFVGLRTHAVKHVHRIPSQSRPGTLLRDFDVAIVELEDGAPVSAFPMRMAAFSQPPRMTVAGWGLSDAPPINQVALEVTEIRPDTTAVVSPLPPTLQTWSRGLTSGGGICMADSGGPVFAGELAGGSPATLPLIGIVAGANPQCREGRQALTDLTPPKVKNFICGIVSGARYCL